MASNETGWLDELPKRSGWYFTRIEGEETHAEGLIVWVGHRQSGVRHEGQFYLANHKWLKCREYLGPISPSDAEQLIQLRKSTIEACLKELREALPMGRIEIRADMTESGQIHITILNAFLDAVPYGSTLADAMNQARAVLNPDLQKETR